MPNNTCGTPPYDNTKKAKKLVRVVKAVNMKELDPTEVLSDNVYYFDRATSEVRIA